MAPSVYLRLGLSLISLMSLGACAHQPATVSRKVASQISVADIWQIGPLAKPNQVQDSPRSTIANQLYAPVSIYFTSNRASLSKAAKQRLDRFVEQLTLAKGLQITGFTEGQATPGLNRTLAMARAEAVSAYLVDAGTDADLIRLRARSDCCYSIATGAQNSFGVADGSDRRAEIKVISPTRTAVLHFDRNRVRDDQFRLARYSTLNMDTASGLTRPLESVIQTHIPVSIRTVGDAIQVLLSDSGYRLAKPDAASPARKSLLALPLPHSQRALGPLTLRAALTTLAGPAYRLVLDPVHRLISFALAGDYQSSPSTGCAVVASLPPKSRPLPPCRPVRGAPACPSADDVVLVRNLTVVYAQRVYRLSRDRYCRPAAPSPADAPIRPKAAS